jgi:ABC-type sugar transport system ATPase subunit
MGQNGAGKSTIFKMITGEYKVNDGRILITQ